VIKHTETKNVEISEHLLKQLERFSNNPFRIINKNNGIVKIELNNITYQKLLALKGVTIDDKLKTLMRCYTTPCRRF